MLTRRSLPLISGALALPGLARAQGAVEITVLETLGSKIECTIIGR